MMRKTVDGMTDAINDENYSRVQKALREMRDVIDQRVLHYASVAEIRSKLEQRRKLVETEQKITLAGEQAITIEQAMLLVGTLAGILKAHIHDAATLNAIQTSIRQVMGSPERPVISG
jgi:hypothetical protein